MNVVKLSEIPGDKFPAGRWTRVITGEGKLQPKGFMMGYVVIYPQGKVPQHEHENEEIYTILKGSGTMSIGNETRAVEAVASVYIPPNTPHALINNGSENLEMLFVYSPATIVNHWSQEKEGKIK